MVCPTQKVLRAFLSGELSWDERAVVVEHVDTCPICRESAQRLAVETQPHEDPTVRADQSAEETDSPPTVQDGSQGKTNPEVTRNRTRTYQRPENPEDVGDFDVLVPGHGEPTQPETGHEPEPTPARKPSSSSSKVPETIGKFSIIRRAGSGGFAEVYQAHNPDLEEDVAIKVLHAERVSREANERFRVEAKTAANLRHPNIVSIRDVEVDANGQPYVIMDWMEGGTLEQLRREKTLSIEEIVEIMTQVAQAAAYAHKRGFVHRDLKPSNILFDKHGRPHIADFGLAIHERELRERQGEFAGTRRFMSPEQVRRDMASIDGRCDVWALGVILYLLLTAEFPFDGSARELEAAILDEKPKAPRALSSKVPEKLQSICLDCLKKDVEQRLSSANDLVTRLKAFKRSQVQKKTRRKFLMGAGALLATGGLASWGGYWVYDQNRRIRAEEIFCLGNAQWDYDDKGNVFYDADNAEGLLMLAFGNVTGHQSFEIKYAVEQQDGAVGAHFYFARRNSTFHCVSIHPLDPGYELVRQRMTFTSLATGDMSADLDEARSRLDVLSKVGMKTKELVLHVTQGQLASISFAGTDCIETIDDQNKRKSIIDDRAYNGEFGFLATRATGKITHVELLPLNQESE